MDLDRERFEDERRKQKCLLSLTQETKIRLLALIIGRKGKSAKREGGDDAANDFCRVNPVR